MAQPAPTYDLVILLAPNLEEDVKTKILGDAEAAIAKAGEVVSKHDWGLRKTEFEIRKKAEAEYHLLQFKGTSELLQQLDRTLRITDGVQRFRIIKLKPGTPDAPDLKNAPTSSEAGPSDEDGDRDRDRERVPAER